MELFKYYDYAPDLARPTAKNAMLTFISNHSGYTFETYYRKHCTTIIDGVYIVPEPGGNAREVANKLNNLYPLLKFVVEENIQGKNCVVIGGLNFPWVARIMEYYLASAANEVIASAGNKAIPQL